MTGRPYPYRGGVSVYSATVAIASSFCPLKARPPLLGRWMIWRRVGRMSKPPTVIDTHCHLTGKRFADDLPEVLARAQAVGVAHCVLIGTGIDDALAAVALAADYPDRVSVAAAIDPFSAHALDGAVDDGVAALAALADAAPLVAIGECGLDYHYDLDPRPLQRAWVTAQLALAAQLGLPVILHVRDAHDDMLALLAEHPGVCGTVHCFTGDVAQAERYLALGWYLSCSGMVTNPRAEALRQAVAAIPDDRLLLETDAPYLAPMAHRGRRCEPAFVVATLADVAALRQQDVAQVAAVTTANARRLLALPGADSDTAAGG